MRIIFLLIIVILNMKGEFSFAQEKLIDIRYKGKELGFRKFLGKNLNYPVIPLGDRIIGYSISEITITPKGKICSISIINPLDSLIDEDIKRVLKMTENRWLESDSILINQTFYVQIAYLVSVAEETPEVNNPVKDKYNFIEPVVVTVLILDKEYLPLSDETVGRKSAEELKKNEYGKALKYIDELIRRNPFNKELYQLRISINRKLNKQDLIFKDAQKIQNFIPGVSLDELLN